jgi:tetratricopeptide (TPR) repeat protein
VDGRHARTRLDARRGAAARGRRRHGKARRADAPSEVTLGVSPKLAALFERGLECLRTGDYEQAERLFSRGVREAPALPDGHLLLADARMRLGRHVPALEAAQRAVRLKPGWGEALALAGTLQGILGRHADAQVSLSEALRVLGPVPEVRVNLAHTLRKVDRIEEALEHYDAVLASQPSDASLHLARGEALHALGRLDEARSSLQRSLELEPASRAARFGLATVLHAQKHYDDALALWQALLREEPAWGEALD